MRAVARGELPIARFAIDAINARQQPPARAAPFANAGATMPAGVYIVKIHGKRAMRMPSIDCCRASSVRSTVIAGNRHRAWNLRPCNQENASALGRFVTALHRQNTGLKNPGSTPKNCPPNARYARSAGNKALRDFRHWPRSRYRDRPAHCQPHHTG